MLESKASEQSLEFGELFIGLVGPIGANLTFVCEALERALRSMKLDGPPLTAIRIAVIEEVHQFEGFESCKTAPEDERITSHMDQGDSFRADLDAGDALALNAVRKVQIIRKRNHTKQQEDPPPLTNTVFIFKSLKHPHEVRRLREVYGTSFYLISCYMSEVDRWEKLARRISGSLPSPPSDLEKRVSRLLERDYDDRLAALGQKVSDCFHLADVFVDVSDESTAGQQIDRFVKIIFSHPFITPTRDEFAMFHARAAGLRSSDLSRQVGAVICNASGAVIATGTNEVPMAGGGTYSSESARDHRDFREGHDSSSRWKRKLLSEVMTALAEERWLTNPLASQAEDNRLVELQRILKDRDAGILRLIEFLRPVHAEMAVLMDAARRGISVEGGTLYSTTFPCHECTRLIIAAGIIRVVYVEPYPKSAARDLYSDSILIEPSTENLLASAGSYPRVLFQPFVGVAPRMYLRIFDASDLKRKEKDGKAVDWTLRPARLRFPSMATVYMTNEKIGLMRFSARLESAQIKYGA